MNPSGSGPVKDIAIIGAGWAGLSAAHHLVKAGRQVTLFEMSPIPGGRARQADVTLGGQQVRVDNGQHLLIGGYRETLALMRAASNQQHWSDPAGLIRLPLQFSSTRSSIRRRGPAQAGLLFGILTARGFGIRSRLAIATLGARLALAGWQTRPAETVSQLLTRLSQPDESIEQFWAPMCIAALNTAPDLACAQVFANVLHDSMLSGLRSSDFLIPATDLGTLMPVPMLEQLTRNGATARLSCPVRRIRADPAAGDTVQWQVHTRIDQPRFRHLVLATPIHSTARLLADVAPELSEQLLRFSYESIQTVYVAWPEQQAPAIPPITMLDQDDAADCPGQWLFARPGQSGLTIASVVVSAPPDISRLENSELARQVGAQLVKQLRLPAPLDTVVIHEKRATFSCTPNRPLASHRHVNGAPLPEGIRLAGDYCWPRYPATLESAVLSGINAARDLLA